MSRAIPSNVKMHYLNAPDPHKKIMLNLRKQILEILPKSEEVISYGMPAFKFKGNIVAGILANKNHVGYYPFSGSVLPVLKKETANYSQTKSALHVPLDGSISKTLLKKLIQVRISQCPVKTGKVDLSKYEKLDKHWKDIGIAAPARRGLVDAGLLKLRDLTKISEIDFAKIHGMGPSAKKLVAKEMKKAGIKFKINSAKKRS